MPEQIDSVDLSQQLKKPTGELGIAVPGQLNSANKGLYDLAFEMLDLKAGEQVLEIGFGNGKHFPRFFEAELEIFLTGIDFSEDMCVEARKNNPYLIEEDKLTVHCVDSSSTSLPDQSFDWIVALNVIYFWEPPEKYLNEIQRLLKPGGKLLLGYHPRHSMEDQDFTKQNFTLYEPEELNYVLKENDFIKIQEKINKTKQTFVDGTEFESVDICEIFIANT
ncbi:MAG: class I SAM-dependent methyltransferase [Balneolaceae bacterium]